MSINQVTVALLLAVIGLFSFLSCKKPKDISAAQYNWDGIIISDVQKTIIERHTAKFPPAAQISIAIITPGQANQLIGLHRQGKQFNPADNFKQHFEIGSITKTFTTALLSKMENQNLVKYNDLLQSFLPKPLNPGDYNPTEIQLRHLANHTSGLPRLPGNMMKDIVLHKSDPYRKYTADRMLAFLHHDLVLPYRAGEKYEYSNYGVAVLGHVLSLKTQRSYESLILEEICRPLDLTQTMFELQEPPLLVKGIDGIGNKVSNWHFDAMAGCGALKSTLTDMVKYTSAQLSDTTHLAAGHIKTIDIDPALAVGLGWHISQTKGREIIWHNGGTGGYTSCIAFDKERQTAVVTLTNVSASAPQGAQTDQMTFALLEGL